MFCILSKYSVVPGIASQVSKLKIKCPCILHKIFIFYLITCYQTIHDTLAIHVEMHKNKDKPNDKVLSLRPIQCREISIAFQSNIYL